MSAVAANTRALAEAKDKRQKKILVATSVTFLALLGYQLPKLMSSGQQAQTAAPTVTDASSVPGSPLAVAPAGGALPDTDRVVIEPGSGQLISFGLFKSKDPFIQQLSTVADATGAAPTAGPIVQATTTATTTPATTTPSTPRRTAPNGGLTPVTTTTAAPTVPFPTTTSAAPIVPTPGGTTTPTNTTTTPAAAPTSVSISTNGICESLGVNATFPGTEDIFRVISIARDGKSVKIGVVGGAYDSGQSAATLKLGEKLTLVNTADGTRYVLLLKARCDTETQPVTGSGTSTVAAPTTTSTVTSPIVTDALDTTTPSG